MRMLSRPHPGELLQEVLEGQMLSVSDLAKLLDVDPATVSGILQEQASVTPEMSRKLGELLNQTPDLWHRLQAEYDEWQESQQQGVTALE
jgi:addiction module HigA family antidote